MDSCPLGRDEIDSHFRAGQPLHRIFEFFLSFGLGTKIFAYVIGQRHHQFAIIEFQLLLVGRHVSGHVSHVIKQLLKIRFNVGLGYIAR